MFVQGVQALDTLPLYNVGIMLSLCINSSHKLWEASHLTLQQSSEYAVYVYNQVYFKSRNNKKHFECIKRSLLQKV